MAPGYILTDVGDFFSRERADTFVKGIPMRRYGQFDDLNGPLLMLCSDASKYSRFNRRGGWRAFMCRTLNA